MIRKPLIRFLLLLPALAALFCAAPAAAQSTAKKESVRTTNRKIAPSRKPKQTKTVVPDGVWGAAGVNLTIGGRESGIEYDCAEAAIDGKFLVNKKGEFDLKGTFTRRSPGPVQIDRPPARRAARFTGRIDGERMTLRVILIDDRDELPAVVLKRGAAGKLRRCY